MNVRSTLNMDVIEISNMLWRWWIQNIVWTVPSSVQRRFRHLIPVLNVDFSKSDSQEDRDTRFQESVEIVRKSNRERSIALNLSDGLILTKKMSVPARSRSEIKQILYYKVAEETPYLSEAVLSDFCILGRSSTPNYYDAIIAVTEKQIVEEILERAQQTQIKVAQVRFDSSSGNRFVFWKRSTLSWAAAWRAKLFAVGIICLVFLGTIMYSFQQLEAHINRTQAELSILRERAIVHGDKQQSAVLAKASLELIAGRRNQEIYRSELLLNIAEVLPVDSWITSITIADETVSLEGFSDSPAQLVPVFEQHRFFENARFGAPLVRLRGQRKEQFLLVLQMSNSAELSATARGE